MPQPAWASSAQWAAGHPPEDGSLICSFGQRWCLLAACDWTAGTSHVLSKQLSWGLVGHKKLLCVHRAVWTVSAHRDTPVKPSLYWMSMSTVPQRRPVPLPALAPGTVDLLPVPTGGAVSASQGVARTQSQGQALPRVTCCRVRPSIAVSPLCGWRGPDSFSFSASGKVRVSLCPREDIFTGYGILSPQGFKNVLVFFPAGPDPSCLPCSQGELCYGPNFCGVPVCHVAASTVSPCCWSERLTVHIASLRVQNY